MLVHRLNLQRGQAEAGFALLLWALYRFLESMLVVSVQDQGMNRVQ
jgi:hypothetical protein